MQVLALLIHYKIPWYDIIFPDNLFIEKQRHRYV